MLTPFKMSACTLPRLTLFALAGPLLLVAGYSMPETPAQPPLPKAVNESDAPLPVPVSSVAQIARERLAAGEQNIAEALLASACAVNDAPPDVIFLNSVCLRSRFQTKEALRGWYHLVVHAPDSPQGQVAACIIGQDLATNLPTRLHYFSGLMVVACMHPDDPMIQWMAAVMARDLTRDTDSPMSHATRQRIVAYGIERYRSVLTQFAPGPGPTLVHQTFANLLSAMEDHTTALQHYRIVMEREPKPWSLYAAAGSLRDLGQWTEALRLCDAALAQDPSHEGAQKVRAECLWALDRNEEALALWISRMPDYSAGNCSYYGELALAAGYLPQARIFLEQAVQLDPKHQVAAIRLARLNVHEGAPGASAALAKLGTLDWRGLHVPVGKLSPDADNSPWFTALDSGDITAVRERLATTPIETRSTTDQASALMIAARCGWTELIPVLLAAGAQLDAQDANRDTALHYAAQFKQHACVQLLLNAGANPNLLDKWGQSPLTMSVSSYQWKTARLLINHPGIDLNVCANNRGTALHTAAGYGQTDIVRTLLAHHAEFNRASPQTGTTPLMMTCTEWHHPDALTVLLEAGAEVNQQDRQGRTALRRAIQPFPAPQLTDGLLRHGADPLIADQSGITPLAAAHLLGYGELATRMEATLKTPAPALPWNLPLLTRPADPTNAEALGNAFTLPIALSHGLSLEPARTLPPEKAGKQARDALWSQFALADATAFKAALLATDRLLPLNHTGQLVTLVDGQFPRFAAGLERLLNRVFYVGRSASVTPLAWRKSHLIYLARLGAAAGYLPANEAEEIAAAATETLRGSFTSWTEFADSFIFGAVQYAGWEHTRHEHLCRLLLGCPELTTPWQNTIWRPTPVGSDPVAPGGPVHIPVTYIAP
ncbi:MAG: ankyrin repeat domain-containing protein [Opitutus sp.]|nr:ankyrin repeat domain-containing protein [Opitutus sp.]MCS6247969.1 ankyrin repeat domain-containing protein [Opitutus sp.]MCS6275364.1 ankyrin repeat domain-containing protein [Opitutus sp.]MCS6276877.1 ankyrin repeat domain-containing protein [Opitutus sp.]MCS6301474.1 ankyrin repeat domain-containing protein [Opitutus sp.]